MMHDTTNDADRVESTTPIATSLGDDTGPHDLGPALDWHQARQGSGLEAPADLPPGDQHLNVDRTFVFADLSGFTRYTRQHGPHEAVKLLREFRQVARTVAAKRGVRVAKWLGDGVMIVSVDPTAAIAFGAHMIHHFRESDLTIRVGVANGIALLFEGDDYIGEPVNLAAKLCSAAEGNEILAAVDSDDLPDWVADEGEVSVNIRGVGTIRDIHRLSPMV